MDVNLKQLNQEIINSLPTKRYNLEGEISGLSTRRGHSYFDFKDNNNKLAGIIFNNQEELNDGDKIKCQGKLSYYAPYGKLSFNVNKIISKSGMGNIYKDFLELKDKLKNLGYFDPENKKNIKGLIKKVIIITSKQGAAIQDIYRNLANHQSQINIVVKDAPVQGVNCSKEISKLINKYNKSKNKIIIITRGGGDYQDLNGFNQEEIIESIYRNKNIIISAIGHETDTVLSDLVADYSLPTPSLVAQFLIDHNNNILNSWEDMINNLKDEIINDINDKIEYLREMENIISSEENKFELWITKLENEIMEEIYSQEKVLDEYINYLENLGEIKLLNYKEIEFTNLEDIGQLFKNNTFYLKIKDRLFKISDFNVKEKIGSNI